MSEQNIKYGWRIAVTLLALLVFGFMGTIANKAAPTISGPLAVKQLQDSNSEYIVGQVGMGLFTGEGTIVLVFLLISLVLIWGKPMKNLLTKFIIVMVFLGMMVVPAQAYYDVKDNPEFVEIGPGQTAFLIPMAGANKSSQGQFGSEAYLLENKVAAKRIQIPHVLIKTTWDQRDYYVPAAKVVIVDRVSYNREWTSNKNTGTGKSDQGIKTESSESINISTAITIAASIEEKNAAKYLYYFGTIPPKGNPQEPAVMYASVIYARSLEDIMDKIGRGKIQSVITREFGKRTTLDALKQKADIIGTTEKETTDYFTTKGVTIEYVGFAEGLTLDEPVQRAINQAFIAAQNALAADAQAKTIPVLDKLADIKVRESAAVALSKWNGALPALPSWIVIPENWSGSVSKWLGGEAKK